MSIKSVFVPFGPILNICCNSNPHGIFGSRDPAPNFLSLNLVLIAVICSGVNLATPVGSSSSSSPPKLSSNVVPSASLPSPSPGPSPRSSSSSPPSSGSGSFVAVPLSSFSSSFSPSSSDGFTGIGSTLSSATSTSGKFSAGCDNVSACCTSSLWINSCTELVSSAITSSITLPTSNFAFGLVGVPSDDNDKSIPNSATFFRAALNNTAGFIVAPPVLSTT